MVTSVGGLPLRTPAMARRPLTENAAASMLFVPPLVLDLSRPTSWLHPQAEVLPVQPRPEVGQLVAAYRLRAGAQVRLVCGRGGQGKSHLAREVCARLREEGWLAGTVNLGELVVPDPDHAASRWARLAAALDSRPVRRLGSGRRHRGALLVVDYAENQAVALRLLLARIAGNPAIRVLLLARHESGWWRELLDDPALATVVHPHPVVLGSLGEQQAEQVQAVHAGAMRCFAARLDLGRREMAVLGAAGRRTGMFGTTLDLYADALLKVLNLTPEWRGSAPGHARENVLGHLLVHERRYVNACLRGAGITLSDHQRDTLLLAPFLVPAETGAEAARAIGVLADPGELADRKLRTTANLLVRLYPGDQSQLWAPPQPDRLPDTHLLDVAERATASRDWVDTVTALCAEQAPHRAATSARVLIRALSTPDAERNYPAGLQRLRAAVEHLVETNPRGYVEPAVLLAPLTFSRCVSAVIARAHGPHAVSGDYVRGLDNLLADLGFTVTRTEIAVAVSRRLVRTCRPGSDAPAPVLAEHATRLDHLALRLAEAGNRGKAVRVARQATALYHRLVTVEPGPYQARQAAALSNLALRLAEVGKLGRAVRVARQTTALFERLAAAEPAVHQADYAAALNNLAIQLAARGQREEALRTVQRACGIYGELHSPAVGSTPAAVLIPAELAREFLLAPGDLADPAGTVHASPAVTGIETAIEITRAGTTHRRPSGYQPALASSLNTLALRLAAVGRTERGLSLAAQAVSTFRQLVDGQPDSYRPDLGAALGTEAALHLHRGELAEAAQTAVQATGIFRRLAGTNPAAYEPGLVRSLMIYGAVLRAVGEPEHAVAALAEAAHRIERFAVALPRVYRVVQHRIRAGLIELTTAAEHRKPAEGNEQWDSNYQNSSTPSGLTCSTPRRTTLTP
ncbi:tetratricopeptide repeat protein [Amycolatopsis albispora]|uniref:tetratricopeptide repeat protein n=1 Tax=Amycolatopsis albispora TaxID=1804986 RepID=UPI0013B38835|nr:tetratricopeptide repeat protein [Amycolatopsis albispora]